MLELLIGNTSTAVVQVVKNSLTGVIDDDATLSITLYEKDGVTEVTGQVWPATMYNEPGGIYAASLEHDLDLNLNHTYLAVVNGLGSNGEVMYIKESVKAVNRGDAC